MNGQNHQNQWSGFFLLFHQNRSFIFGKVISNLENQFKRTQVFRRKCITLCNRICTKHEIQLIPFKIIETYLKLRWTVNRVSIEFQSFAEYQHQFMCQLQFAHNFPYAKNANYSIVSVVLFVPFCVCFFFSIVNSKTQFFTGPVNTSKF